MFQLQKTLMLRLFLTAFLTTTVALAEEESCSCQGARCDVLLETEPSCGAIDEEFTCECLSCASCPCATAPDFPEDELCCRPTRDVSVGWFLASSLLSALAQGPQRLADYTSSSSNNDTAFFLSDDDESTPLKCETVLLADLPFCGEVIDHVDTVDSDDDVALRDARARTVYERLVEDNSTHLQDYSSCRRAMKEAICYGQFPECGCDIPRTCMDVCESANDCYADFSGAPQSEQLLLCPSCDVACGSVCETEDSGGSDDDPGGPRATMRARSKEALMVGILTPSVLITLLLVGFFCAH